MPNLYPQRTIFLDTETTGLNRAGDDDVLEVSVINDAGDVLLDTLVQPMFTIPTIMASKTLVIKIEKNDDEQRMNNYRYGIPTDLAKFISEKWHVCECAHEDFKQTCWYDLKMLLKTLTRFSDDDEQREVYEILISIIKEFK